MVGWIIIEILIILTGLGILFLLQFYRDPLRKIPQGSNIVSPADGRIIKIIKFNKDKIKIKKNLLGRINTLTKDISKKGYLISIFMSPFDVHINRAPMAGKVIKTKYEKGKFFAAYDLKKSFENEKNEIVIKNKDLKIKVIQIAGFLARRIECFVKKNQNINKGQKIGRIVLGSQVSLIIPDKIRLVVKEKQKVKAGSSIIAEIEW